MSILSTVFDVWWKQWGWQLKAISIVVAVVIILLVSGWLFSFCGSTPVIDQKKVDEQIEQQKQKNDDELKKAIDESDQKIANIQDAVNKAAENTNQAINRNFNNTNQSEANKARCLAFPDSRECR